MTKCSATQVFCSIKRDDDQCMPAQIPKKPVRERLSTVEGAAAARLSKKLVQLQTHMDLPPLR